MPKIIVDFGGGNGLSSLIKNLAQYKNYLRPIITIYDDEGDTGKHRRERGWFGGWGDIRRTVKALAPEDNPFADLIDERLKIIGGSSIDNLVWGNYTLGLLHEKFSGGHLGKAKHFSTPDLARIPEVIEVFSRMCGVSPRHKIIPVSLDSYAVLHGRDVNGKVTVGEGAIGHRDPSEPRLSEVFLDPGATLSPGARKAIPEANTITTGPGSLYTSQMSNLVTRGCKEAVQKAPGNLVVIINVFTQRGETDGYTAADHAEVVCGYLERKADYIICHDTSFVNDRVPKEILSEYEKAGSHIVKVDRRRLNKLAKKEVIYGDFIAVEEVYNGTESKKVVRHSPPVARRVAYI